MARGNKRASDGRPASKHVAEERYASILPIQLFDVEDRPLIPGSLIGVDLPQLEFEDCTSQIELDAILSLAQKALAKQKEQNDTDADIDRPAQNGKRALTSEDAAHEKSRVKRFKDDHFLKIIETACRFEVLAREYGDLPLVTDLCQALQSCSGTTLTILDDIRDLATSSVAIGPDDAEMLLRHRLDVRNEKGRMLVSLPIVDAEDGQFSNYRPHRFTNNLWLQSLALLTQTSRFEAEKLSAISSCAVLPVLTCQAALRLVSDGVLGPHTSRNDVFTLELAVKVFFTPEILDHGYSFRQAHDAEHLDRILRFAFHDDANEALIRAKGEVDASDIYGALLPSKLPTLEALQPAKLEASLFPFQKRSVNFLLGREGIESAGKDENGTGSLLALDGFMTSDGPTKIGLFWRQLCEDLYYNAFSGAVTSNVRVTQRDYVKGGILAEEMGLGKTVEIFALILLHASPLRSLQPSYFDPSLDVQVWPTKTTLIVAPEVLRQQWLDEVALHAPELRAFNYYGYKQAAEKVPATVNWAEFARSFDVMVVSFDTLRQELNVAKKAPNRSRRFERKYERPRSLLIQLAFHRVVMDEVQLVGHSMAAETVSLIARDYSIAVSGTPIKQLADLQSLFTFLRVPGPVASKTHWNRLLQPNLIPTLTAGLGALATRHTKSLVRKEMTLPQQMRILMPVEFTAIEAAFYRDIYQRLLSSAGIDPSTFPDEQGMANYVRTRFAGDATQLRATLLALRQACTHPQVAGSGVRGTALAASQTIRSMDEVLTIMIEGAKSDSDSLWHSLVQKRIDRAVLLLQRRDFAGRHNIAKVMLFSALQEICKRLELLRRDVERGQNVGPLYRFDSVEERDAATRSERKSTLTIVAGSESQAKTQGEREREHAMAEKVILRRRHLNALQLRMRQFLEQQHRCHYFIGNVYFQLGELAEKEGIAESKVEQASDDASNGEKTENGTASVQEVASAADLKQHENEAYDAAESVRQDLLKETRKIVEQAIDGVQGAKIDFDLNDLLSNDDVGEGGLRTETQFDKLNDIQVMLNNHADVVFDWREKIWHRLQKPVNRVVSAEKADDDQYAENLDAQAEAEALLEMYRVLISEREYMLTGVRIEGALGRPQLFSQLEREVPQYERAMRRAVLQTAAAGEMRRKDEGLDEWLPSEQEVEVLRQQLDHFTQLERQMKRVVISRSNQASEQGSKARRRRRAEHNEGDRQSEGGSEDEEDTMLHDLVPLDTLHRELREIQQNTDRIEEIAIARRGIEMVRHLIAEQKQMIEKLKKESLAFSAVWNARAAYFKQIQDISDQVRDISTADIGDKTANLEREEATLKRREELNAGRLRYLQAIEEEEEGAQDQGDEARRICPICTEPLIRAVVLDTCGHTTCDNCFRSWTAVRRKCPMCKSVANPRNIYRVTYGKSGKKRKVIVPEAEARLKRNAHFNIVDDDLLHAIHRQPVRSTLGSKLDQLTRHLLYIENTQPGVKSLIFTAFARGINLVGDALRLNGVKFVTLDQGGARGGAIIDSFKNDPAINVLLLHSEAQSSGLNLVCAQNIFLLEPLVNHALELQAIGRVHRIGQTRQTKVFCYQVSDTVEQRIAEMARKRKQSLFTHDNCVSNDLRDSAEMVAKVQHARGLTRINRGVRDGEFVGHIEEMISCLFPDPADGKTNGQDGEIVSVGGPSSTPEATATSSSILNGDVQSGVHPTNDLDRMRRERLEAIERRWQPS